MKRKCPYCGKEISWLEVSKQIEGSVELPDAILQDTRAENLVKWKPPEDQVEPVIYSCPECLNVIDNDKVLREWGLLEI